MPDIDFQRIELNLIPKKGDEPVVFYASQYETARPFIAALKWGNTEFAPGDDYRAEIDIRKNDDNLVVITDDVSIDNNEVSVVLPVQAVTCIGKNLGQVKIYSSDDHLIAALNFILEVQADPLAGGVTSETAIDNLTQQIEDIAQEVIGDDYYNKTEVDTLLADKADVSDLPDMSQYYTKTATDTLLNAKADKSDTYTKAQVDSALSAKANTADLATVATTGDYDDLLNKPVLPDMTQYYTKSEVDILIDNIIAECAELEIVYPDPEFMQKLIGIWSKKELPVWQKLYDTTQFVYNPIWNVDADISITRVGSSENTDKVSGYNSESWSNSEKNENGYGETITENRTGNIGVTASQDLIKKEREIADFSIVEYITQSFKERFCLLIY